MMEKLAIVILNWNGETMLRQYLPSVLQHSSAEATVYVADNASTDGSIELLHKQFPSVKTLLLEKNWGFAEGYNKALQMIDAEYYLLLNSDVETTPHWLTPLIEFMDSHHDVAACQPKLLAATQHDTFEYAGASGGYIDRYGYPFCRGRLFGTVETDHGQYNDTVDVHWATGAAMLVRARIYKDVGGLDARFFAHCEEIDLCWRMRIRGYRICCVPTSHVYHLGGGTLPQGNPMKTFLNFRNNLTMLYKCLPEHDLHRVMRRRWWLDHLAAIQQLLLERSWSGFRAIIKGRKAYKQWRHSFDGDRRDIQQQRITPDAAPLRPYSILWQYYAKHRQHYSQLPD